MGASRFDKPLPVPEVEYAESVPGEIKTLCINYSLFESVSSGISACYLPAAICRELARSRLPMTGSHGRFGCEYRST